ncbi:molybdopterin-containing oxidoreductase family protein [Bradyrhizobium erythrophlei]|jgi:anaerobic selenocysteine-containing dehydrogenase|uniref:Anaerobic selenocysteine-containing dehydrogenase n=1 Tax=Bradyrhizobium erythrophlei TaxID=1437360 RepID=A0A1M5SBZ9_9BRAD|nr:molybdopterin-dependent oxidoreductase [Bradyrhizobium erythrophlei]SHH36054.1 Anaerobic selenocysteine-containing dehydrogenase [Bradyrhizobium erythrophlei]
MSTIPDKVLTTCPRDCYDACGILVERRDGKISRVVGDPNHFVSKGSLCGKCAVAYNGGFINSSSRLLHPLRRTGPKGAGQWEQITWDDAIAVIAAKLKPHIAGGRASKVIQAHYTGTVALLAGNFPLRFFNAIGATEVDPDTVCNKAGHAALQLVFGDSLSGFDPRTVKDSNCIMVWGANPATSAPHVDRHWLKSSKATRIVIDPIKHKTAQEADLFLQPRPGSDASLAFAMLHVIRELNLLDRSFIESHAIGWPSVAAQLDACTPEWGEAETGVPAALIRQAAEIYARGPSLLWLGQGLQRQPFGGNVFRACSLLPVATGNMMKPGAGLFYMNGFGFRGVDMGWVTGAEIAPGASPAISHMDLHEALADPRRSSVFFTWNCNPAASSPNQKKLVDALKREDLFHVAIDIFPTDTVDYADIVLPAASFLEFDDLVMSYFDWTVSAQTKASEPFGSSKTNMEMFRQIAEACRLSDRALFEQDGDMLEKLLHQSGIEMGFSELSERGTVFWSSKTGIPFVDGRFSTNSGKIELAGPAFVDAGLPTAPTPHADAPPAPGFWRVLSPASSWLMNSSYGSEERIRRQIGPQTGFINPAMANAAGLVEGEAVILFNETGELPMRVGFDAGVPQATILLHKGRWPKYEMAGANVNILNPGQKTDLAESSSVHGIEVRIRCAMSEAAE